MKLSAAHQLLLHNDEFKWEEDAASRLRAWAWIWALAGMLYLPVIFGLQRVAHVGCTILLGAGVDFVP